MDLNGATHEYAKWASKRLKTKKESYCYYAIMNYYFYESF